MIKDARLLLIISCLLLNIAHVQGQPSVSPDSALQVILTNLEGAPLSLKAAVEHGLENATSVRLAEATMIAARGKLRRERGVFDPELFFSMNYVDDKSPTSSFFSGAPVLMTVETSSQTGLRMSLPIGTQLEASLSTDRLTTNSSFAFLNPQYTTFGSLSLRQPLLGGFQSTARKELSRSEEEFDAAHARYDQEALATASEVERTYWDLYAVERNYAVQRLIKEQAESFLHETEVRAKVGLVGPNQVATAKTFLAEQTVLLLDREEQLDQLSDRLASLIGTRPTAPKDRYVTTDEPPASFPEANMDELLSQARERNLELRAAQSDVEAVRAQENAANWGVLPKLDVIGSIGGNGLSGNPQAVIFNGQTLTSTRSGTFGEAINEVFKRQYPSWSVGVELTIPIGLRNGLGERERLEGEVMMAEQRYIARARLLEEQVRASYREIVHGTRRLAASKDGVAAAQEQVRIGLIEFRNGRSTAFELVRLGADFAAAQQRYSEALVRTAKAATTLKQLTSGGYSATTTH